MKLPKAIEILEHELPLYLSNPETDLMHAIKLGKEAIERVLLHRTDRRYPFNTLLPSETED